MESKLEAYRLKKRREVLTNKMKESKSEVPLLRDSPVDKVSEPFQPYYSKIEQNHWSCGKFRKHYLLESKIKNTDSISERLRCPNHRVKGIYASTLKIERLQDFDDLESIASEGSIESPCSEVSVITRVIYLLYFLSWATLYVIALHYEFGAVYFIITALIFIWKNTRTSPKKKGEVSAYSVFNPNCAAIQGSINMEQLEREMGLGVPRVH